MTMHIVHLEDTKPLRDILLATITALRPGCKVKQFINSDETIKYIEENIADIDIFLLDVRVPGSVNGLGVAEKINQLKGSGLIVMTSAYLSPGREKLDELNARWYQKPWQIQDMQDMLKRAEATRKPIP
jgi:DNA-binding NtrC family response regulator